MGVYIDIALSLVFIYLVLSLVVSAVDELVAMWLRKRPAMLAKSILSLIDDPTLWRGFYDAGVLVNPGRAAEGKPQAAPAVSAASDAATLKQERAAFDKRLDWHWSWLGPTRGQTDGHPSFIDGATFARALTEGLLKRNGVMPSNYGFGDIEEAIRALDPDSRVRDVLVSAASNAGKNLRGFEAQLEAWYDRAQDRLSGAYARWAKVLTLIIGAGLVLMTNADTIRIAQELRMNGDARSALVERALVLDEATVAAECAGADMERCRFDHAIARVGELGPDLIGWRDDAFVEAVSAGVFRAEVAGNLVNKLLGLLITIAAISLGAPFWFDMLSKVVNIRAAGRKPESTSGSSP